jgi:hypothetical protein
MSTPLVFRGPTVQRADTDCERDAEGCFPRCRLEVFDRNLPHAWSTGGDLVAPGLPQFFDSVDDRSLARMCPSPIRCATARAAAPGPQPISSTWIPGRNGNASTIAASRGERGEPPFRSVTPPAAFDELQEVPERIRSFHHLYQTVSLR